MEYNGRMREELIKYIQSVAIGDIQWTRITAQISKFTKEKMTYGGIQYALWYQINIKHIDFNGDTLGLIPYIYDEARDYYENTKKTLKKIRENDGTATEDTITVREREEDVFK